MATTGSRTSAAAALADPAAAGTLPPWAVAGEERRAHIRRVASLMETWAERLALPEQERERWRAAAWLHDALRDAPAEELRAEVEPPFRELPDPLLHGPAAAKRLEAEGVDDAALLNAIRYHTLGHPDLDRLGRMLYLADFLEPGRTFSMDRHEALRRRMPDDAPAVLIEVVRDRIEHLLRRGSPVRPETMGFWNSLVTEERARTR
jgi:HD superfamily phosphohydrolase YqeK